MKRCPEVKLKERISRLKNTVPPAESTTKKLAVGKVKIYILLQRKI
jgi:hypothetical protein